MVSLSRFVADCPYPMRDQQTVDASLWMVGRVSDALEEQVDNDFQIFDRSPLDVMAFTRHASGQQDASDLLERIAQLSAEFHVIFLCTPAGEWPAPETPSESEQRFALYIQELMEQSVSLMRTSVVRLPWESEDRLELIATTLRGLYD